MNAQKAWLIAGKETLKIFSEIVDSNSKSFGRNCHWETSYIIVETNEIYRKYVTRGHCQFQIDTYTRSNELT